MKSSSMQGEKDLKREKKPKTQTRVRIAEASDLQKTPLFKNAHYLIQQFVGLDEQKSNREKVIYKSYICDLKQNQQLELVHDGNQYLYLILKGHIRVLLLSSFEHNKTDTSYFVAWRKEGQILGEMNPLTGEKQPVIFIAATDCELIEIPSNLFIKIADQNPILYRNLVELLIRKTFDERLRKDLIQTIEISEQVVYTLIKLYEERGYDEDENGYHIIKGIVRAIDIAEFLGFTRQYVSPQIQALQKQGVIQGNKVGRNVARIKILNVEKLYQLAPKLINEKKSL